MSSFFSFFTTFLDTSNSLFIVPCCIYPCRLSEQSACCCSVCSVFLVAFFTWLAGRVGSSGAFSPAEASSPLSASGSALCSGSTLLTMPRLFRRCFQSLLTFSFSNLTRLADLQGARRFNWLIGKRSAPLVTSGGSLAFNWKGSTCRGCEIGTCGIAVTNRFFTVTSQSAASVRPILLKRELSPPGADGHTLEHVLCCSS